MNPIRRIRRFATVLAGGHDAPGHDHTAGRGSHRRRRRHARLADRADRRRGRPARGHARGAGGPGPTHPAQGDRRERLAMRGPAVPPPGGAGPAAPLPADTETVTYTERRSTSWPDSWTFTRT